MKIFLKLRKVPSTIRYYTRYIILKVRQEFSTGQS